MYIIASQNGHTRVIEILLREHADISIQSKKGLAALTIASLNGHTEVVEIFLKKQLDINSQREDRMTALILASQNGYTQVVELLVKEHADVNRQRDDKVTALMLASHNAHFQIAEILLKEHADISIQTNLSLIQKQFKPSLQIIKKMKMVSVSRRRYLSLRRNMSGNMITWDLFILLSHAMQEGCVVHSTRLAKST